MSQKDTPMQLYYPGRDVSGLGAAGGNRRDISTRATTESTQVPASPLEDSAVSSPHLTSTNRTIPGDVDDGAAKREGDVSSGEQTTVHGRISPAFIGHDEAGEGEEHDFMQEVPPVQREEAAVPVRTQQVEPASGPSISKVELGSISTTRDDETPFSDEVHEFTAGKFSGNGNRKQDDGNAYIRNEGAAEEEEHDFIHETPQAQEEEAVGPVLTQQKPEGTVISDQKLEHAHCSVLRSTGIDQVNMRPPTPQCQVEQQYCPSNSKMELESISTIHDDVTPSADEVDERTAGELDRYGNREQDDDYKPEGIVISNRDRKPEHAHCSVVRSTGTDQVNVIPPTPQDQEQTHSAEMPGRPEESQSSGILTITVMETRSDEDVDDNGLQRMDLRMDLQTPNAVDGTYMNFYDEEQYISSSRSATPIDESMKETSGSTELHQEANENASLSGPTSILSSDESNEAVNVDCNPRNNNGPDALCGLYQKRHSEILAPFGRKVEKVLSQFSIQPPLLNNNETSHVNAVLQRSDSNASVSIESQAGGVGSGQDNIPDEELDDPQTDLPPKEDAWETPSTDEDESTGSELDGSRNCEQVDGDEQAHSAELPGRPEESQRSGILTTTGLETRSDEDVDDNELNDHHWHGEDIPSFETEKDLTLGGLGVPDAGTFGTASEEQAHSAELPGIPKESQRSGILSTTGLETRSENSSTGVSHQLPESEEANQVTDSSSDEELANVPNILPIEDFTNNEVWPSYEGVVLDHPERRDRTPSEGCNSSHLPNPSTEEANLAVPRAANRFLESQRSGILTTTGLETRSEISSTGVSNQLPESEEAPPVTDSSSDEEQVNVINIQAIQDLINNEVRPTYEGVVLPSLQHVAQHLQNPQRTTIIPRAGDIYRRYLDAPNETELLHLQNPQRTTIIPRAGDIYRRYLDAPNETELLPSLQHVAQHLQNPQRTTIIPGARDIYRRYLEASGETELLNGDARQDRAFNDDPSI